MNDNAIIGYVMNRNILNRIDLSNWVIHFVHQRKSEDNPQDLQDIAELEGFDGDLRLSDYYDDEGNGHNILSPFEENEYWIDENASAFDVLLKILHDGFIHSGWSLRNLIPTIYGPKSAVCFTEMPLYMPWCNMQSFEVNTLVMWEITELRSEEMNCSLLEDDQLSTDLVASQRKLK